MYIVQELHERYQRITRDITPAASTRRRLIRQNPLFWLGADCAQGDRLSPPGAAPIPHRGHFAHETCFANEFPELVTPRPRWGHGIETT